jgi:hypothetical protein
MASAKQVINVIGNYGSLDSSKHPIKFGLVLNKEKNEHL